MFWLQTGQYDLAALGWLIAVAVVFVIAVVALVLASTAAARTKGVRSGVEVPSSGSTEGEQLRAGGSADATQREVLGILNRRYAKGAMSREDYGQRRKDLLRAWRS